MGRVDIKFRSQVKVGPTWRMTVIICLGPQNRWLQQTLPREASQRTSMFFSSSLMVQTHKISYHYARKEGQAKLKSMKNHPTNTRKDESWCIRIGALIYKLNTIPTRQQLIKVL